MKSTEDGLRYDAARVLDGAMDRSALVERPMCPQRVIITAEALTEWPFWVLLSRWSMDWQRTHLRTGALNHRLPYAFSVLDEL